MIYIGIIDYTGSRSYLKMTPFEADSGPSIAKLCLYRSYNPPEPVSKQVKMAHFGGWLALGPSGQPGFKSHSR
jgi:hypothetical protein